MRTIWVAIRGINYTDQATRQVGKNIDALIKAQEQLRTHATRLLVAGVMWVAMAGLATFAISKIISASYEGRKAMHQLGLATNNLMKAFSEAFMKVMGPTITMLTTFMNLLAKNQPLLQLITILTVLGLTMLVIKGMSMVMIGGFDLVMLKMTTMGIVTASTANTMALHFLRLQAAMGPIILGFTLGATLASLMGEKAWMLIPIVGALTAAFTVLAGVLWGAATALSILTVGGAAIAGIAAIAYAQSQVPKYQYGTRMVQRTQPAIVHAGDMISRPDRGDRIAEQPRMPFVKGKTEINISMGTVQTKADKEELKPLILKVIREALDDKA